MNAERQIENQAHEVLRDAIRDAALAKWDRQIAAEVDENQILVETRPEVAAGVLVDYVVVAVFDSGQDHTVTAILRTDGQCSQYRTVGLLQQALHDVKRGG